MALPADAVGPAAESKLIRLELEEALSGGIRLVVEVYLLGRRNA
jgi:hypothetical protein